MKRLNLALAAALLPTLSIVGCSSTPQERKTATEPRVVASVTSAKPDTRLVKSRDGTYTGEVTGVIAEGSRFSRLQIGMSSSEVQDIFGRAPDRSHTYESGKRWIPFYFGNDARRMQVLYKGEGCLIFTGGNIWGGAGGDLTGIHADSTDACYQP